MRVYEYLTLTEQEALCLLDLLSDHHDTRAQIERWEMPRAAYNTLMLHIQQALNLNVKERWGVDADLLVARIALLTEEQARQLLLTVADIWAQRKDLPLRERIAEFGLV
jgi:hypothetical protein